MKRVLLVRFGGLGDLLIALPSIRLIRGKYPDAHLTLACRGEYGALFRETGVVDEIMPEDSRRLLPLFSEAPTVETEFRERLGSYDLVIGWTQGQKGGFLTGGPAATAASVEMSFINADARESGQLSRHFFRKTAEILGAREALPIDEWARLPTGKLQRAEILNRIAGEEGKKRIAVVHPGSGSESKRWPLENFLRIIGRIGELGVAGALVTGEAEENIAAEVERATLPQNWTWIRRPGLTMLASLLSETGVYLGSDSGVTHLAAACGAEVVALFRQEYASAWAPLGRVHLRIADSLSEISPESVWEIVTSRLPSFSADSQNCQPFSKLEKIVTRDSQ